MQLQTIEIDDVQIGSATDTDHATVGEADRFGRHSALLGDERFDRNTPRRTIAPPPLQQCCREAHITDRPDMSSTIG